MSRTPLLSSFLAVKVTSKKGRIRHDTPPRENALVGVLGVLVASAELLVSVLVAFGLLSAVLGLRCPHRKHLTLLAPLMGAAAAQEMAGEEDSYPH